MASESESTVKQRLLEFLSHERISQVEFTRSIGVASSYVAAMRRSISDEKMAKIRELYPQLNTDWLLYGDGPMLRERTEEPQRAATMVPLLPVAAYAGHLDQWASGYRLRDCELIPTPFEDADLAITVSGDSMEPELHDGSTLYIKRINDRLFIPWGSKMVIDTENGVLVKCVFPSGSEPDCIEARSINPDYPPIDIPKYGIYGLYRILGVSRTFLTL